MELSFQKSIIDSMKETELAQHFINFFSDHDVYKEVPYAGIIDIVAVKANIVTAIEVKCSLNFDVIEQAVKNIGCSNYSYIAVPLPKSKSFAYHICKNMGIGVLCLTTNGRSLRVVEVVKPKFNRKMRRLKFEAWMKESVAGSQNERMTAFKNTVRELKTYLERRPDKRALPKDAINGIAHHYGSVTSARTSLLTMIDRGVITDFRFEDGFLVLNQQSA